MVTGLGNLTSEEKLKEFSLFRLKLRRLTRAVTAGYRGVKIGDGDKKLSMPSVNRSNIKQNQVILSLNISKNFLVAKLVELCYYTGYEMRDLSNTPLCGST